jgi:hypothetical protein
MLRFPRTARRSTAGPHGVRLVLLVLALALAACDRSGPTEARVPAGRRPVLSAADTAPVQIGTFKIPIHPPDKGVTGEVPWMATGIVVQPGEYVRVYIDNPLVLQRNPVYEPLCYPSQPCFPEEFQSVAPPHPLGPRISFGDAPVPAPGVSYAQLALYEYTGGTTPWVYLYHNSGTTTRHVYVMRPAPGGRQCPDHECYKPAPCCATSYATQYHYSGQSQMLIAERIQNPVRVRALTPRIRPGEVASFSVNIEGMATGISWVWAPNDTLPEPQRHLASVNVTDCADTECTFSSVYHSGRMYVTAQVEGKSVTNASEVVWRRGCAMFESPPADSLLSNGVMLNVLEDLAKQSPFSGYVRDRKEHGGYLIEKNGRLEYRGWKYDFGYPTTCGSSHVDERHKYIQEGYMIRGEIHSHPSGVIETIDTRGGTCPERPQRSDFQLKDGPSGSGLKAIQSQKGDLDPWETGLYDHLGYVIDPLHVHRWERRRDPNGAPAFDGNGRPIIDHVKFDLKQGAGRCIV